MDADSAEVELDSLIGLFFSDSTELGRFSELSADQLPEIPRGLLAHNHHMTVTLEQHYACPVSVAVHETRTDGELYSRKITLLCDAGHTVMYGIVRLDLAVLNADVRAEILQQQTPLGRILISHNVLRAVKLLRLFLIEVGTELQSSFGFSPGQIVYGRTALIYCDGSPAIELLEIVRE